jgi:predicted NAD/FAD-binding protein
LPLRDQTLALLSDADDRARAVPGAIRYAPYDVYLRRGVRLMPKTTSSSPSIGRALAADPRNPQRAVRCSVIRKGVFGQDYAKTLAI